MKRVTLLLLAASLLAAGAFAQAPRDIPSVSPDGPSFLETVILHRWGYGALDWLIPHDTGDRDERKQRRRA